MPTPEPIERFLSARRIAVAGVSRDRNQPANAIFRRLRDTGHEVVPVNPEAAELEGAKCYPDLAAVPGAMDAVMIVTHPSASADVVRQAGALGIDRIWFHRSVGDGSVSSEALDECARIGVKPVAAGCPLMFCGSVDPFHRCMRWFFGLTGRVPR